MGKPYLSSTNVLVFPKKNAEPKSEDALAEIKNATLRISRAKTVDEALKLKAILKVAEIEAQRKGLADLEKEVIELKFMLEDKTGEILEELKETGKVSAGRPEKNGTSKVLLKSLGLTKNESSRAQKFHKLPAEKKAEVIEQAKSKVAKPRKKKPIETTAEGHVHKFVCSCGAVAP